MKKKQIRVSRLVYSSKSREEEGVRRREEVLKAEQWKLSYECEENSPYNAFFSLKELKWPVQIPLQVKMKQ